LVGWELLPVGWELVPVAQSFWISEGTWRPADLVPRDVEGLGVVISMVTGEVGPPDDESVGIAVKVVGRELVPAAPWGRVSVRIWRPTDLGPPDGCAVDVVVSVVGWELVPVARVDWISNGEWRPADLVPRDGDSLGVDWTLVTREVGPPDAGKVDVGFSLVGWELLPVARVTWVSSVVWRPADLDPPPNDPSMGVEACLVGRIVMTSTPRRGA